MSRLLTSAISGITNPLTEGARQAGNVLCPIGVPEPGDLLDLLNTERMQQDWVAKLLSMHGITTVWQPDWPFTVNDIHGDRLREAWRQVADLRRPVPSWDQLNLLALRGLLSPHEVEQWSVAQGWTRAWSQKFVQLQQEIPGPSDLIRFVVKDVWDVAAIKTFGYNAEYPDQAEQWLAKQGLAYPIPSPLHDAAGLGPFSWARAYWWSHWQLPAPGQAQSMLHRLRYRLDQPAVPRDPSGEIFTLDNLELLLKTQDYPVFWRTKLAAIGFHPIGIRNLRALFKNGQLDEVGVAEVFLDQGFNKRDALLQARLLATEKEGEDLTALRKAAEKNILRGFQLGTISHDQAVVQLFRQTFRRAEQLAAFDALPAAGQLAAANASQRVQLELTTNMVDERLDRIDRLTKLFHRSMVKGAMSAQQAQQQLVNLGIDPRRIQDLIAEWTLEASVPERIETTSQIIRWANEGLITSDEARLRLADNHWAPTEIDLLLADAGLEQIGRRIRAVQAQSRGVHANQRVAAQAARLAQQQLAAASRQLARSASPGRLEKLLASGIIDGPTYTRRVTALGISPEDAALVVEYERRKAAQRQALADARARARVSPTPVRPKTVTASTVLRWLKKGVVDEPDARLRLRAMGYGPDDVDDFLRAR